MKLSTHYLTTVLFCTIVLFLLVSSQSVYAGVSPYINFKLGYSHYLPITFKDSDGTRTTKKADTMSIGGSAGISITLSESFGVRTELEYLYRLPKHTTLVSTTIVRGRLETQSLLANAYFDYYIIPRLSLYIGAGLGFSVLNFDLPNIVHIPSKYTFAVQGGLGFQYMLFTRVVLDFNVRYTYLGKWRGNIIQGMNSKGQSSAIETMFSLGYKF